MVSLLNMVLLVVATVIGSLGSLYLKKASDKIGPKDWFRNFNFLFGGAAFGLAMFIYLLVLREEKVSIVYPIASMSYIWTSIFSVKYLGESMGRWKVAGLALIIMGIILLNL